MTKSELLDQICNAFGKRFSNDSLRFIADELSTESVESFKLAVNYFMANSSTLPSPIVFVRRVRIKSMESRESTARLKKTEHEQPNEPIKTNNEMASAVSFLVGQLTDGEITRRDYLQGMTRLEDKFPGAGFIEQAEELHAHYQKHGDDLNKPSDNYVSFDL